ncbi:sugar ABC transporter ATP-binding protein [Sulfolobales archaeon HS-7]|nr:sugar ABC transporter ATP-binding protein [Sulfolobales archaeon HS-7]
MIDAHIIKKYENFTLDSKLEDDGFILVTGENGSGKSTFLKCIAGAIKQDSGYVRINSRDITNLPIRKRGVVLITADSFLPNLKVQEHLRIGGEKVTEPVKNLLNNMSIPLSSKVGELSMGQREVVAILTAILAEPPLILIDEALANIENNQAFLSRVWELRQRGKYTDTIIVSHQEFDLPQIRKYQMSGGRLIKIF